MSSTFFRGSQMVYCVLSATSPLSAAVGPQDRNEIAVRHIFPYLAQAEAKARELRREVLTSLASDAAPSEQFVNRMMTYRSTVTVATRYMAEWPKEG